MSESLTGDALEAREAGSERSPGGREGFEGSLGVADDGREAAPVRPPKQERSRRTLDRIAVAALELFQESGVEGTTVSDIVQQAETSVGSFYARFPGKDDLVRYLRDEFRVEVLARWDAELESVDWANLPLEGRVDEAVGLLALAFQGDWRLSRVLGGEGSPRVEGAWWAGEFRTHVLATLSPLLLVRGAGMPQPPPLRSVETGYRMVAGALRDAVEAEGAGEMREGSSLLATLAPELARAWTAYLGAGGASEAYPPGEVKEVEAVEEPEGAVERTRAHELEPGPDTGPETGSGPEPGAVPPEVDFFDPWG